MFGTVEQQAIRAAETAERCVALAREEINSAARPMLYLNARQAIRFAEDHGLRMARLKLQVPKFYNQEAT